mmetsp:Transcript_51485/g.112870  ORF Transcript_51485/g.112870 Transcript_51485/m.112870 type:complete len:113 (-) Transcript_51485:84-422(-)
MIGLLARSQARHSAMLAKSGARRSTAVYRKLWVSTAKYAERRNYGKYQIWQRMLEWSPFMVISTMWYMFGWFSDDWKHIFTGGLYIPLIYHPDTNNSAFRGDRVKEFLRPYE